MGVWFLRRVGLLYHGIHGSSHGNSTETGLGLAVLRNRSNWGQTRFSSFERTLGLTRARPVDAQVSARVRKIESDPNFPLLPLPSRFGRPFNCRFPSCSRAVSVAVSANSVVKQTWPCREGELGNGPEGSCGQS